METNGNEKLPVALDLAEDIFHEVTRQGNQARVVPNEYASFEEDWAEHFGVLTQSRAPYCAGRDVAAKVAHISRPDKGISRAVEYGTPRRDFGVNGKVVCEWPDFNLFEGSRDMPCRGDGLPTPEYAIAA